MNKLELETYSENRTRLYLTLQLPPTWSGDQIQMNQSVQDLAAALKKQLSLVMELLQAGRFNKNSDNFIKEMMLDSSGTTESLTLKYYVSQAYGRM